MNDDIPHHSATDAVPSLNGAAAQAVHRRIERALLACLIILVIITFFPLLGYFFSQDDFQLMHLSTSELHRELAKTFGPVPYHVRPLTKFVYFAVTHRLFGLNPLPYHVISLLVHLANTLIVFALLRRFRLFPGPALVSAALFGMNVAFFHAIGWISCIQQLAGTFFMLLSILLAVESLIARSTGRLWLSAFAYVLALLSVEQTFLVPVLGSMILGFGLLGKRRHSIPSSVLSLWPHYLIFGLYVAMRIWKGVPDGGRTRFQYGVNILENISCYAGGLYSFWPNVEGLISREPFSPTAPHGVFVVLIIYHLIRRRVRQVVFAVGFVLAVLLPALFLVRHYFYYHTYAASFGAIYLVALALQDLWKHARFGVEFTPRRIAIPLIALLIVAGLSTSKVRENARRAETGRGEMPTSFVIRRALIAERFYDSLTKKQTDLTGVRRVHVLWGAPGMGAAGGKNKDVAWALGNGHAVNLFLGKDLEVSMDYTGLRPPQPTEEARVFFYDRNGDCYTYEEVMGRRNKAKTDTEHPDS